MQQPPLLPEAALHRVIVIARRNGLSVVLIASIAALLEAAQGHAATAVAAVLAAGTGAMEMHGATLLRHGVKRGMSWLVRAELLLLAVIWVYCAVRLLHPDLTQVRAEFHASLELPLMRQRWEEAKQLGLTEETYLNAVYQLTYVALALVTLIYQGGMTLYYLRRYATVEAALESEQ